MNTSNVIYIIFLIIIILIMIFVPYMYPETDDEEKDTIKRKKRKRKYEKEDSKKRKQRKRRVNRSRSPSPNSSKTNDAHTTTASVHDEVKKHIQKKSEESSESIFEINEYEDSSIKEGDDGETESNEMHKKTNNRGTVEESKNNTGYIDPFRRSSQYNEVDFDNMDDTSLINLGIKLVSSVYNRICDSGLIEYTDFQSSDMYNNNSDYPIVEEVGTEIKINEKNNEENYENGENYENDENYEGDKKYENGENYDEAFKIPDMNNLKKKNVNGVKDSIIDPDDCDELFKITDDYDMESIYRDMDNVDMEDEIFDESSYSNEYKRLLHLPINIPNVHNGGPIIPGVLNFQEKRPVIVPKKVAKNKPRILVRENECRRVLEMIYNKPFKKANPEFLKTPDTNKYLELDMYNEELGIACEHNGSQHYVYPHHFHKNEKSFLRRIKLDKFKIEKCKEHGVHLISVPYHEKNIEFYIKKRLPKKIKNKKIKL